MLSGRVIILIIAIVLVIYACWRYQPRQCIRPSDPNHAHHCYNVIGSYENRQAAADLIGEAHARAIKFMRYLKRKYHIDETADQIEAEGVTHNVPRDVYNMVDFLLDNYNPEAIRENDPKVSNETSYTINKGCEMYLCLRDKTNPARLVDINTLMFVLLHEQSHIANYNGWGHDNRFWEVFKFILHEAVLCDIYQSVDYERYPVVYCGLPIVYNPLNDPTLRNLWEG